MTYDIVSITEDHIEGYRAALDSVARERKYLALLEAPSIERVREYTLENIRGGRPHYVALNDNTVIGWCDIGALNRPVWVHSGVLGMGIIAPHRGKGIGKALMQAALDRAKAIGLTRVELTVREANTSAMELYKKMGFVVEGLKRNATCIEGKYENDVCMGLLFE